MGFDMQLLRVSSDFALIDVKATPAVTSVFILRK